MAAADAALPPARTSWIAWPKAGLATMLRRLSLWAWVDSALENGRNVTPRIRSMAGR